MGTLASLDDAALRHAAWNAMQPNEDSRRTVAGRRASTVTEVFAIMPRQLLGTFPTRDVADSVKDRFLADGFAAHDLIVMANRLSSEPPEAADLEVGTDGPGGFAGLEEKVGKAVRKAMGKHDRMDGDLTEGEPNEGALLAVTLHEDAAEARARAIFEAHRAGDIELVDAE